MNSFINALNKFCSRSRENNDGSEKTRLGDDRFKNFS